MRHWETYDRWNTAVREVFFPEREAPEPAYIDFEPHAIELFSTFLAVPVEEVEEGLARATAATLQRDSGPAEIFRHHERRLREWVRASRKGTPPFLALLATFSLAAEQMDADETMSSNNYYGRLKSILDWPRDDHRLDQAYRRVAEGLWSELNRWLLELDGLRGLPTAFALNHRFVGLPVSQALIRSADHEKIKTFFHQFGFSPGASVAPTELEPLFDAWVTSNPCPVSSGLRALWQKAETRQRILEVAAISLANWDGVVREAGDGSTRPSNLLLTLELGAFPRRRFGLSVIAYTHESSTPRDGTILTAIPEQVVPLIPDLPGTIGLGSAASLDPSDALEGHLKIRDELTGRTHERRPRRLVVFREDELSRRWIETPQVMLGENVRILCIAELGERLEELLRSVARPGWTVLEPYPSQPENWILVDKVEILGFPGNLVKDRGLDDLAALVPLTSSQLKVSNGFALPGRIPGKWHTWAPPEIRAVSDTPGGFTVRVIDESSGKLLASWSDGSTGVVVRSLTEIELEDGDYRIELCPLDSEQVLSATTVHLRSSDSRDMSQWSRIEPVAYGGRAGVLGVPRPDDAPSVRGFFITPRPHAPLIAHGERVPSRPTWAHRAAPRPSEVPIRIAIPSEDSCVRNGRHKERIDYVPLDKRGRPLVRWVTGECTECGLVRTYPTRPRSRHTDTGKSLPEPRAPRDLGGLPPVESDRTVDYETAFDALLHIGGGPWSYFERIALQVHPTALFVDQFARNLEALGHIDVRRDPRTLQPTYFEVCATTLTGTATDYLLAGFWPASLYSEVYQAIAQEGIEVVNAEALEAPSQYFVSSLDLPRSLGETFKDLGVLVVDRGWEELAHVLPPLSEVLSDLPREQDLLDGNVTQFDPASARWVESGSARGIGGFRVRKFSTAYFVRTPDDLAGSTVARSTAQLSKHAAAYLLGRPLLAYDEASATLTVPLGAELPGLYGRCVVAASGLPPVPDRANYTHSYREVPAPLAHHIYRLLRS